MGTNGCIAATVGAVTVVNLVAWYASARAARTSNSISSVLEGEERTLLRNIVLLVAAVSLGLFISAGSLWDTSTPRLSRLVLEVVVIFLLDDAFFYAFHRALHTPFLFRRVHAVHHSNVRPVAIEYLYAHPVELLGGTGGSAITMVALGGISIVTLWTYLVVRTANELRIHVRRSETRTNGYFDRHLAHHWLGTGNFCSLLPIWDRMFHTTVTLTGSEPAISTGPSRSSSRGT